MNRIYIFLFLLILSSPHILNLFGSNFDTVFENLKTEPPKFSIDKINKFPRQFENYYSKTINIRKFLMAANSAAKKTLLNYNSLENDVLLTGKDNWLFYFFTSDFKNDITRKNRMSQEQLSQFFEKEKVLFDKTSEKGITYIKSILPDAHDIYSNFLPERIKYIQTEKQTRRAQIVEYFNSKEGSYTIIDPTTELNFYKKHILLYFKNDTHWNELGAYIAFQKIMASIKEKHPETEILSSEDYEVHWIKNNKEWTPDQATKEKCFTYPSGSQIYAPSMLSSYFNDKKLIVDSIPVFIPLQPVRIKSKNKTYNSTLLLSIDYKNLDSLHLPRIYYFGDSYGEAMMKFLIPHASTLHFRRQKITSEEFDKYHFKEGDIIIDAHVARSDVFK